MNSTVREIRERLFALKDEGYQQFQCSLMPGSRPRRLLACAYPICAFLQRIDRHATEQSVYRQPAAWVF
jgi:hypothetical protein